MITTNEDILAASLVLQDVFYESANRRRIPLRSDGLSEPSYEYKLAKHCMIIEELVAKERKAFNFKWKHNFTMNSPANSYKFLHILGAGSFGRVVLAKKDKAFFAAKFMEKREIIKNKQLRHVHQEIRILDALRCDFLVYLEDFVRTNCYIILVMPFIRGGELLELLRKLKKCNEDQAKFYAAQVIIAFEYMHGIGVIYRDLKPENIMIDETGYIKLTDFGFCKRVDDERTWSLCGTPEYLAPEIILNQGYNRSVDFWSFGILVYELVAGYPPFMSREPMKLYDRIVSGYFTFPQNFSPSLQNLLSNVIQVDKTRRYGLLRNGTKDIKSHAWFRTIDWDAILNKTAAPSYQPKLIALDDTSNFRSKEVLQMRECEENEFQEDFAVITVSKKVSDTGRKGSSPSRHNNITTKAKNIFGKLKK